MQQITTVPPLEGALQHWYQVGDSTFPQTTLTVSQEIFPLGTLTCNGLGNKKSFSEFRRGHGSQYNASTKEERRKEKA